MNARLARITLLLAILTFIAPLNAEYPGQSQRSKMNEPKIKRVQFFDSRPVDTSNAHLAGFSAILNIAEAQPVSARGISFELSLQYNGINRVEIHNPLYFVQYNLTGSGKGQRFDNKKPPIPLIHRQGKIDPATDFSFQILAITRNGQNLDIHEQVNTPILAFTQGGDQKYSLQISRFTDEKTHQSEEIPEGKYHLEIVFSIVRAGVPGKTVETPESRMLKAQETVVLYKPNE